MEFIAKIKDSLGSAIAKVWSQCEISSPPHRTTITTGSAAHLNRFGVYAVVILTAINVLCYALAYLLAEAARCLAMVIELAT